MNRKVYSVVILALCLVLLATGVAQANRPQPQVLGDVNRDGKVNSTDALIVLSCIEGINCKQFCPLKCGDVNGDKQITKADADLIFSYGVGLPVAYPIGQNGCARFVKPCPGCRGGPVWDEVTG